MRIQNLFRKPAALLALSAPLLMTVTPAAAQQDEFAALANEAAALMHEIALLEDHHQVERLQRAFGYYIDEDMWTAAADLFTADGTYEEGGSGVYVGRDHILAFFQSKDAEGPQYGRLNDQMQLQPVVHVSPDGLHAKGRWHSFSQTAQYQEWSRWGTGVYETSYVKQDGVWKIEAMHLYTTVSTPYEDGWGKTALPISSPSTDVPPDQPPSVVYENYPAVFVAPFHYENPVTGAPTFPGNPADYAAPAPTDAAALTALLDDAQHRAGKLADGNEIENLHAVYGYYLARNQWDHLAGIFAREGTIEIAMRGIYKGYASVRRNLDLYGTPGEQFGLMHNHMQYQPIIDVADDRQTAQMRSRAFSIMGNYEGVGMWMGGIYENVFVKEDGVWKIGLDRQVNTYFTPYATGWTTQPERDPPGITDSNPPDLPPTGEFKMFPNPFLVPYHYPHPVTGLMVSAP